MSNMGAIILIITMVVIITTECGAMVAGIIIKGCSIWPSVAMDPASHDAEVRQAAFDHVNRLALLRGPRPRCRRSRDRV
jgi:hypothetical protein